MKILNISLCRTTVLAAISSVVLSACGNDAETVATRNEVPIKTTTSTPVEPLTPADGTDPRWYTAEYVARGEEVYDANCSQCHGSEAEGVTHWRERDANGNLPPPPLNGTAHTWHHPIPVLVNQIKNGTPAGLGTMPGFGDQLSDDDIVGVIAWLQSKWSDEVYTAWLDINRRAQSQNE